ncbi:MAG: hypothetical protein E6H61_02970 [Betaproteobacteria bacterium]|nr:MAG: hypothetical protein E6H61_02970 [Betaproteobacteria bacterium]
MGHKGTVRLARILANRSKTALEEAVLLTSEELGFRYFMFCGRFSQLRGATHEVRFDNFPLHWHRYCADRGRDLLPGPLHRLALQEVTPLPWRKIAARHGKAFAKAGEFGLVTGVSCSVHGPRGQWTWRLRGGAPHSRNTAGLPARRVRHSLRGGAHCPAWRRPGWATARARRRSQPASQRPREPMLDRVGARQDDF